MALGWYRTAEWWNWLAQTGQNVKVNVLEGLIYIDLKQKQPKEKEERQM